MIEKKKVMEDSLAGLILVAMALYLYKALTSIQKKVEPEDHL